MRAAVRALGNVKHTTDCAQNKISFGVDVLHVQYARHHYNNDVVNSQLHIAYSDCSVFVNTSLYCALFESVKQSM